MFNFIDRTVVSVLGEAIRRDLGLSDLQLGLMGGLAFSFLFAAMGIPLARLAERRSRIAIIAVVTAIWSAMTMLSGAAMSFAQLLVVRMGVGVGEAGFTPALMSMISDRFSPDKRATVFSLIAVGVSAGGATAALAGGALAQAFGWRATFLVVGAPGLVLAILLWATIPEPARDDAGARSDAPPFAAVLVRLARSPAFVCLTVGSGMVAVVGFGMQLFFIPMVVRRFGFDLREAGLAFALSFSLATGLGAMIGGQAMDRLAGRNLRWYCLAPAAAVAAGIPCYVLAIRQGDWRAMIALLSAAMLFLYAFLPAIMTATQRLVEPRMRASAAAIHAFGQTVFGLGVGSTVLGWASDRFARAHYAGDYGQVCLGGTAGPPSAACVAASGTGVQLAMLAMTFALVLAVIAYLLGSRSVAGEIERFEAVSRTEVLPAAATLS